MIKDEENSGEIMTLETSYCPDCGTMLTEVNNCPVCGKDLQIIHKEAEKSKQDSIEIEAPADMLKLGSEKWQKMEPIMFSIWTWAWLITGLIGLILWIISFVRLFQFRFGRLIYFLLNSGAIFLILLYGGLYNRKIQVRDYHFIKNDAISIGMIQIPKILFITFLISIGLYWVGGILVFIPAILIIFLGPGKMRWRLDRVDLNGSSVAKEKPIETKKISPKKDKKPDKEPIGKKTAKKSLKKSTKKSGKKSTKKSSKKTNSK